MLLIAEKLEQFFFIIVFEFFFLSFLPTRLSHYLNPIDLSISYYLGWQQQYLTLLFAYFP